jgi:hypothetical protein
MKALRSAATTHAHNIVEGPVLSDESPAALGARNIKSPELQKIWPAPQISRRRRASDRKFWAKTFLITPPQQLQYDDEARVVRRIERVMKSGQSALLFSL